MDRFAELDRPRATSLFDYVGAPRGRARDRDHGLGRRDRARDRRVPRRAAARRSACSRSASTGRSRVDALRRGAARRRVKRDRRPRPHQGAGRDRRAALPGRRHRPRARRATTGTSPFAATPRVVGGRYGLSSKEFTPAMVKAVFDDLAQAASRRTTSPSASTTTSPTPRCRSTPTSTSSRDDVVRAVFFGLGADGTVGANKNSIKIIGEETDNYAQGYFVYDSKKSGAMTDLAPALRPAADPLALPDHAGQLRRLPPVRASSRSTTCSSYAAPGAIFLLNSPYGAGRGLGPAAARGAGARSSTRSSSSTSIDAYEVAKDTGMGGRINTIMQTCFFAISGVLPREEAIAQIKKAIKKTYGKKGEEVVQQNYAAVDATLAQPARGQGARPRPPRTRSCPPIVSGRGARVRPARHRRDASPARATCCRSAPSRSTAPGRPAPTQWEKRNIALEIPVWDPTLCIQCNKCALVCPHAAIRAKVYDAGAARRARRRPSSPIDFKGNEFKGMKYTIQVAPEDCTGCTLCVAGLPGQGQGEPAAQGDRHGAAAAAARGRARRTTSSSSTCPSPTAPSVKHRRQGHASSSSRCSSTPAPAPAAARRRTSSCSPSSSATALLIANATGCSSIYGGNLPTTPYTHEPRRPRPGLVELALRGQRRVRPRLPPGRRQARRAGAASSLQRLRRRSSATTLVDGAARRPTRRPRPASPRSASASSALRDEARRRSRPPEASAARAARRLPGQEERLDRRRRRLGLRHRLRRPRPRAGHRAATSTSWCSTPRSTPTPAARRPRPRRSARWRSSPPAGKADRQEGPRPDGHEPTATSTWRRSPSAPRTARRSRPSTRPRPTPGPSLIIAYSHCIAHGYDLAIGVEQQKLRSVTPAVG